MDMPARPVWLQESILLRNEVGMYEEACPAPSLRSFRSSGLSAEPLSIREEGSVRIRRPLHSDKDEENYDTSYCYCWNGLSLS